MIDTVEEVARALANAYAAGKSAANLSRHGLTDDLRDQEKWQSWVPDAKALLERTGPQTWDRP